MNAATLLSIHQIKSAFNSLNALVHAIKSPIDPCQPFLDVVDETIHPLHGRQTRLDFLQHGHDKVGDFARAWILRVLDLFRKCDFAGAHPKFQQGRN